MEHFNFLFVFSFPSNLVFPFTPQSASQSLLCLMYVIPILRNTWMYSVYVHTHKPSNFLPLCLSPSCPSALSCTQTHSHTHISLHTASWIPQWDSNAGVRRVPQTALNLSETLMPVGFSCPRLILDVRILVCSITSNWVYQRDLITRGDLSLHTRFWKMSLWSLSDLNEIKQCFLW